MQGLHTVRPSGLHLWQVPEKWGREGGRRGENAIFLSLAKYIPGGEIMTGSQQDRKRFDEISKPEQTGLNLSFRGKRTTKDAHKSGLS